MDVLQPAFFFTGGLASCFGLAVFGLREMRFPAPTWIPFWGWYYYDSEHVIDKAGRGVSLVRGLLFLAASIFMAVLLVVLLINGELS